MADIPNDHPVLRAIEGGKAAPASAELRPTAELLGEIVATIERYVVMPSKRATLAAGLWVLHSHALDGAHATPYLIVDAPTKRAGKTRLQEVLELLVARPWRIAAASESAMFRKIAKERPTLLLDECDALFKARSDRNEAVRAVLNAGNRPGASVARVVGEGANLNTVDFSVYCAKCLAGIDSTKWPDTITDRAIVITLQRRTPGERIEKFRHRKVKAQTEGLRAQLERWGAEHSEALLAADPAMPDGLDDRAEEAWEPLIAIAELAGVGDRAGKAALDLARDDEDEATHGQRLLAAILAAFGEEDRIAGRELWARINSDERFPFANWRDGKGIDGATAGRLLKPYGIRQRSVRIGDETPSGYLRDQFTEAWARYVPHSGHEAPQSTQTPHRSAHGARDVASVASVASNVPKGVGDDRGAA